MADEQTSLAVISSRYQTVNTYFVKATNDWERVLGANPNRWSVMFHYAATASTQQQILPGPPPTAFTTILGGQGWPIIYKFRDHPSWVTGEWYMFGIAGADIFITECVYLG